MCRYPNDRHFRRVPQKCVILMKTIKLPHPEEFRPNYLPHLHVAVFDKNGTDRKLRPSVFDPCYSHQKRRPIDNLEKYYLVAFILDNDTTSL